MIKTKKRITALILDDRKLEKIIRITKEIENKKKLLNNLVDEITEDIKGGAITHPKSIYEARLIDKPLRFSPKYKDLLKEKIGNLQFGLLMKKEENKFNKDVKNKVKKPKKELEVKKKEL